MGLQSASKFDDREIISNISGNRQDNRKGEEKLFTNYSYFINEAIRKHSFSHDEAFDTYADTILIAIDNIRNGLFEGRSSLKTYLFQIYHNKCVDLIRKKTTNKFSVIKKTISFADFPSHFSDSGKSVIQELMEKSEWELLKVKLNELGENCKKLLMLWANGYKDREVAESLEYKTTDVVKTSRLRCLEKLRQYYKKKEYLHNNG